ncbi:hypothetical protein [Streptomyces sp. 8N616]|uniref:hypothetical protein n=1 Tax=Streptomyces sp. 8N616 TaxID=3457414 RepID=UPI003FD28E5A
MSSDQTPPAGGGGGTPGEGRGRTPTDGTPKSTPDPDRPTHGTPWRRRPTLVAVSVAAAVLLAGGGGAYWASTASEGGDGTPAAGQGEPPPLELDGYARGEAGDGPGIAPGEPDPQGARYRATGELPDGPDSAPVYRAQDGVTRAQAEKLAKALGVSGAPRLVDDTWKFGLTRDASGPTLDVSKKAPGTWTYVRYGKGGGPECAEPPMSAPQNGEGDGSSASRPTGCATPDGPDGADGSGGGDGAGPVSQEKAKKAAEPVLDGIGLSEAKLDASRTIGAVRIVNANPVYGELPSYGWQTGLQVGSDGQVVGGSGHLTELKKGPDYPVLGAADTLKLLNKASGGGKVGIGGCASAVPHDGREPGGEPGEAHTLPCAAPDQAQQEPKPLKVRDAVFGLAIHFVAGQQALVPSWMFEVEQPSAKGKQSTYTVTHPAVQEKYIAQAAPQSPGGPGTGGDEPTAQPAEPGKPGKPGAGTPVHVDSYSADDGTLTVRFWGGVCSDYSASADTSSPGTVKVQVTGKEKKPGQVCIKIAKLFEKKVTLDKPLGDRKVVDAATGKAVQKGTGEGGPAQN